MPSFPLRALHLFALSGFAIAQPLFDLLGRNATFFVAHSANRSQLILLALAVTIVPPLLLILFELIVGAFSTRLGWLIHLVVVGSLVVLAVAPPIVRSQALGLAVGTVFGLVAFLFATFLYIRSEHVRRFLTWAAVAPPIFLVAFLLISPARSLVLPRDDIELAAVEPQRNVPIVILILDELSLGSLLASSGEINQERFPNFARLADTSTWYREATTVADFTERALPAMLSGLLPQPDKLPVYSDYRRTLFSLLGSAYDIEAKEFITRLCPREVCPRGSERKADWSALFFDTGMIYAHLALPSSVADRWLPSLEGRWAGFVTGQQDLDRDPTVAEDRLQRGLAIDKEAFDILKQPDGIADPVADFNEMLGRLNPQAEPRPTFWYTHLSLPHAPHFLLPDGRSYFATSAVPGLSENELEWSNEPELVLQAKQRYLLQVGYADRLVGRLLDKLIQQQALDEVFLVVASDHGVSFRPGGHRRGVTPSNQQDILPIPLFIKQPGQTVGEVDHGKAQTIDILPTVADVIDLEVPWETDGASLLSDARSEVPSGTVVTRDGVVTMEGSLESSVVAREIESQLGSGGHPYDLYAPISSLDLMGKRVQGVENPHPSGEFELDNSFLYEDVQPASDFVPVMVTGALRGVAAEADLLTVLNDRMCGVAVPYQAEQRVRFSSLVSPRCFRTGVNRIRLFVRGEDGGLHEIHSASNSYAVDLSSDVVSLPSGDRLPIEGETDGDIQSSFVKDVHLRVFGWAADLVGRRVPSLFLFLHEGEVVRVADTVERPDVAERVGDETFLHSGFYVELPLDVVQRMEDLTIIAVFEREAGVVPHPRE